MLELTRHAGTWVGTNGFRLLPEDPLDEAPASARVSSAARGGLTSVAYAWAHPEDGEQDGLLVLGPGDEPGAVVAFWGDSWHQEPEPRLLDGTVADGVVTVGYAYAEEWRWEITVDATDPGLLAVTMHNVVPPSGASAAIPAGPYAAMAARLRPEA